MSSAKNSKRSQGSSALERTRAVSDDDVEPLIDRVTQGVLARLDKAVQESMSAKIGNQTTTLSLRMWPWKDTMSKRKDDHAPVQRLNC